MTANQINFQRLQEDRRHNVATERENVRHNTQTEAAAFGTLGEAERHNRQAEVTNWYTTKWQEGVGVGGVGVNTERNRIQEDYNTAQVAETHRHNVIMEFEEPALAFFRTLGSVMGTGLKAGLIP